MDLEVGEILEGKVTGITKFGAFVQLPGGVDALDGVRLLCSGVGGAGQVGRLAVHLTVHLVAHIL